ncbi:putative Basal-body rod modification protein FlgD [Nitrospira sp. KM1]|uniref:flagellar hook assembly protein FlgD n=1 Tax=Nitrospira sp. KM1 TaxID=1936990 RepID=UPI0013A7711E|nr:flagellar hook assembly protein FlgD [Nitrospira sp. KM1]BCA54811.1 putative Basal-body rod modification protein FlgD [Nitrospira sp. KM1]
MSTTSGVDTTSLAASTGTVQSVAANQQLGQNDFLNLLVTQLKNQDPLKPMDNQEFVAQLAQFSQLQQSTQQVTLLQQLISAQTTNQQYSLLPLIGRQVSISGSAIQLESGSATFDYSLAGQAADVQVTILDAAKQPVRVLKLGTQGAGAQQGQWDGYDNNGVKAKPGAYQYSITAVDRKGVTVDATTTSLVTVTGVQPNGDKPASLLAGDYAFDPATIVKIH